MTPLEIEICLHYYSRVVDWNNGDFSAPIIKPTLEEFVLLELLVPEPEGAEKKYSATERLYAFVEQLQNEPLPIQRWVKPCVKSDR